MGKIPRRAAIAVVALGLLLSAGCGDYTSRDDTAQDAAAQQVRGQVIEVVARNFTELASLRIRDAAGQEYAFTTEGFTGFTPSHVKEHQLLGQSLLVTYVERGDTLVAVRLED